ncbi:hypothetical protein GCM10007937_11020 [Mesorhizobium albiziae]|nr:hypothetical protein GCM10007937_11020 [Mesorhizobium albiziae]
MAVEGAPRVGDGHRSANRTEGCGSAAVTVEIAEAFHPYMDAAVLRLQSQHPYASFDIADHGIVVTDSAGIGDIEIRKAVLHAVYRERIYAETLSMRLALVAAVTSK